MLEGHFKHTVQHFSLKKGSLFGIFCRTGHKTNVLILLVRSFACSLVRVCLFPQIYFAMRKNY